MTCRRNLPRSGAIEAGRGDGLATHRIGPDWLVVDRDSALSVWSDRGNLRWKGRSTARGAVLKDAYANAFLDDRFDANDWAAEFSALEGSLALQRIGHCP